KVTVVDATNGKQLLKLATHARYCASFSPDGKLLATDEGVWDAATGSKRFALPPEIVLNVKSAAFSADGQRLAVNTGLRCDLQPITIFDAATGAPLGSPHAPLSGVISAVAFSPDGFRLASVGDRPLPPPPGWSPSQASGPMELDLWEGSCGREARIFGK